MSDTSVPGAAPAAPARPVGDRLREVAPWVVSLISLVALIYKPDLKDNTGFMMILTLALTILDPRKMGL